MTNHARKPVKAIALDMGYWPAAQREVLFLKEQDRTQRVFMYAGHLVSEVEFWLDEQGWVVGYMLGYNDGKTGLHVNPADAVKAHRSRALVEVPGGSPYGLLTAGQVHTYRLWAEGVQRGYEHAREWARPGCVPPAPLGYAELRDELLGFCDMPYEMACMIALWLTRDHATMYWLHFTIVL
jgi:hypothetical protein